MAKNSRRRTKERGYYDYQLITEKSMNFEAYNKLFLNIEFSSIGKKSKVFQLTSSVAAEVKTTSICNLAYVGAKLGKKILIIDLDLRSPRTHSYYKIENSNGIVDVLADKITLDDAIAHTEYGVDLLVSGTITPFPLKILRSEKLKETLAIVKEKYDYIFVDTPPVLVAGDAIIISTLVDSTILNVASRSVKKNYVKNSIKQLEAAGADIIGINLTMCLPNELEYYYY